MTPQAKIILDVFRQRRIVAGGSIHPAEFGNAIVWKDGGIRDDSVRTALQWLFEEGLLVEHPAAFELSAKGASVLYDEAAPRYGARIYRLADKLLVKQTVLKGLPPEYVIDEHRERHVRLDDDKAIADAVRAAIEGSL